MADYLARLVQRTLGLLPVAEPLITPSFEMTHEKIYSSPEKSFRRNLSFDVDFSLENSEIKPKLHKKSRTLTIPRLKKYDHRDASFEQEEQISNNEGRPAQRNAEKVFDIRYKRYEDNNFAYDDIKTIPEPLEIQRNGDQINENIISRKEKWDAGEFKRHGYESLAAGGNYPERARIEHETQIRGINPISKIKVDNITGISSSTGSSDMNMIDERIFPEKTAHDNLENQHKPVKFGERILETQDRGTHLDLFTNSLSIKAITHSSQPQNFEKEIVPDIAGAGERPDTGKHITVEPAVKVTIGRVEVKAVTIPDVLRPSRKNPILSLDEYLKQHKR